MKLLYVEDNPRLVRLVAGPLAAAGTVVDTVGSVEEAQAALATSDYDVVLLDLGLPDGDGAEVVRALRGAGHANPVLVTTARSDVIDRVRLLDLGADDYIVKPFSIEELQARIRAVLRRPQQIVDDLLSAGNVTLDRQGQTLLIDGTLLNLPRLEMLVLEALLLQQGRLLPRERLEQMIYTMDAEVTSNAIEAVVSRLRRRLDNGRASVTITAMRGLGYILAQRPSC